MTLTPFNPTLTGTTELEAGSHTNLQQQWTEPVESETVPWAHTSTTSDSSAPSSRVVPLPAGLSSKELARLREDHSRSQSTDALLPGPLSATTELSADTSSSEARRLQSEVESLRREMQELRAERFEAPPLYHEDGVQ